MTVLQRLLDPFQATPDGVGHDNGGHEDGDGHVNGSHDDCDGHDSGGHDSGGRDTLFYRGCWTPSKPHLMVVMVMIMAVMMVVMVMIVVVMTVVVMMIAMVMMTKVTAHHSADLFWSLMVLVFENILS